jgi:winged helix DNA-binding protein
MRASERQRASGHERPAWPGNAVRTFDVAERRRRLVRRQHLAGGSAAGVEDIAGDLVGLHATDPATVYLSLQARLPGFTVDDLDAALYERRTLARLLGMRRTMFVVPLDLAAIVDAACTKALVAHERRRTEQLVAAEGIDSAEELVADACAATLSLLRNSEPVAARAITPVVTQLQQKVLLAEGKRYESRTSITNRILLQLSIEGYIVRTRPLGSWLSSQYRWTPSDRWYPEPLAELPARDARTALVGRWLRTYGPGTTADIAWWTKWTKRQVVDAIDELGAVAVTVEPAPGAPPVSAWALSDDLDVDEPSDEPAVTLLPSLDSAIMGWKEREWYLGGHGPALFDRNGNAGPMILLDGAVVGGWGQVDGGRVVTELLAPVDAKVRRRVAVAADELTEWFAGVRVTPRFPTPLQQRLARGTG